MLASSAVASALLSLPLLQGGQSDLLFTEIELPNSRLRYIDSEITNEEADTMLKIFEQTRGWFADYLALVPASTTTITVRLRDNSKRLFYTNGDDQVFIDFPNAAMFRPIEQLQGGIADIARPALAQLWVYSYLTETADLNHRFIRSIDEFLHFLVNLVEGTEPAVIPSGPGQAWYRLDELYGDGTARFILNTLIDERIPAHRLAATLRGLVVSITEDEQSASLLDPIFPSYSIFAEESFAPGEALVPGATLRLGRLALFNGVRLVDQIGDPLSTADRMIDFDSIFNLLSNVYPDPNLAARPPQINGVDLWDLYFEFRPRVERARDNLDYYLVVRELLARLQDRWVRVMSTHGSAYWQGVAGVNLAAVGERVHVASVTTGSPAAAAGLESGMEVMEIDGRPVAQTWQALHDYFRLMESSSTEAEARARALNVLLTGAEGSTARVKVRKQTGNNGPEELVCEVTRGNPAPTPNAAEFRFVEEALREDGIGVITIKSFVGNAPGQFSEALGKLMAQNPSGLVLDVRGNEGGDRVGALVVLGRFIAEELALGEAMRRDTKKPQGFVVTAPITVSPVPPTFSGPVMVLTDSWTAGAAELLALGFQLSGRGKVVGSATAGSTGQPLMPPKPWQTLTSSGITISVSVNNIRQRNGEPLQGQSIQPDVLAAQTPEDMRGGGDTVLETAVALLRP